MAPDGQHLAPRGLEGVVAASTAISSVADGNLQYRGYAIEELAANARYVAIGRMAGWCAHIMEQHGDNRLIRPESGYTGPTAKRWAPLAER